jgi:hypothetical protein
MHLVGALVFLCLLVLPACGSDAVGAGPAPEISEMTIQSPVASDISRVRGTVHVRDPAGLTRLTVNLTVSGEGPTVTVPPTPVNSTVEGQLEATVGFKLEGTFQSGTYQVAVTVTEAGTESNSLTSMLVVQ